MVAMPLFCCANPVAGLLERIEQGASEKFIIEIVENDTDFFELDQQEYKVVIRGNSYVTVATGLNWYLKYYAGIHLSWNRMTASLPAILPPVTFPERRETDLTLRYDLNYATFAYSMAFWDWRRWEREIDWMALHGINMPLALVGAECVWQRFLIRLGYSRKEIAEKMTGPAFLPWWLTGNMEEWGGPLSDRWFAQQAALQKQILERMREFGMKPVLPGFTGMVPSGAGEQLKIPVYRLIGWKGHKRASFIDPSHPLFKELAAVYYAEQEILFGKADYYAVDLLYEDETFAGIDFARAGEAILSSIREHAPQAVWVVQAQGANPRPELLEKVPPGNVLVLDTSSETFPRWGDPSHPQQEAGFGNHHWAYCMWLNYGGNVGLYGKMDHLIEHFFHAGSSGKGELMKGTGLTGEAIRNNPVMYELFTELPWRNRFSKEEWLKGYVTARYGVSNETLERVWTLLANSVYACPAHSVQRGTTQSVFCARPGEQVQSASSWSDARRYYRPQEVIEAAALMMALAEEMQGNRNFEYDLLDITRQAVAEKGRLLYQQAIDAYWKADKATFEHFSARFLEALLCQDELLGTHPHFMVGSWLHGAVRKGHSIREKELYEWNARVLLTTWGDRDVANGAGFRDYSHREWNGLLADLYYKRWAAYFGELRKKLHGGSMTPIDFYAMEEGWTKEKKSYPFYPEKRIVPTAREVFRKVLSQ